MKTETPSLLWRPLLILLGGLALAPRAGAQFNFVTNNGAITITGYTGSGGAVSIPAAINGWPVTSIGDYAFSSCTHLTSVTLPKSVTSIGDGAFEVCASLTNVTLGTNIASIGDEAFYSCTHLTSVPLPNSVTSIGGGAFAGCASLTNVTLGTNIASIGDEAFGGCTSLTSVTLPSSVTNIVSDVFQMCTSLTNIAVNSLNPAYASTGGVLFNQTLTTLIVCPCGLAGNYLIPNSVTNIGSEAFWGCSSLTSVAPGANITSIGIQAFFGCTSLTSLTIPDSVTSIGNYAFMDCASLTNVTLGTNIISIGGGAFLDCTSLTNVTLPNSVTSIGSYAFESCTNLSAAYFEGNAPGADSTVFSGESGTVFYLPGTTGWETTFGGWPAAAWYQSSPAILGGSSGPGVTSNQFQFTAAWATNTSVVVLACTNLAQPVWTPVATNALVNNVSSFSDPFWTNFSQRFYRVRSK